MVQVDWATGATSSAVCIIVALLVLLLGSYSKSKKEAQHDVESSGDGLKPIPTAQNALPVLGHALSYKSDPPTFLQQQQDLVGPVYRINLAGRRMIVIGSDPVAQKQVATQPESVMSARDGVADVGFEYMLGYRNVHIGTDFHRRVIRDELYGDKLDSLLPKIFVAWRKAFEVEVSLDSASVSTAEDGDGSFVVVGDLFHLVRRVVLRGMIDCLLGTPILELGGDGLISTFMKFQDDVEDATAKAAVLPRFLSLPLALWPVAAFRRRVESQLSGIIEDVWRRHNDEELGPWMVTLRRDHSADEAAELIVGLLFAAHKNPAIGAAQSFLFMVTLGDSSEQEQAQEEAKALIEECSKQQLKMDDFTKYSVLRRCVLETVRQTAHTIGGIRRARKPFVLNAQNGNFAIRAGETLALSHIVPNMDTKAWGQDSMRYRPQRSEWAKPENGVPYTADDYKFTTFSYGVHKCPGANLGVVVMELVLGLLLAHDTSLVNSDVPDVSFERATLAQRDGPVAVKIFCKIER